MVKRDIIVIGASAGGVEALLALLSELPRDFPAALLVVVHTTPARPNALATVINYRSHLPAHSAQQGQPVEPGQIYVAPSGLHMVVSDGRVELNHGPRENSTRPAIDPLFRSAARAYGRRVIGIILSGNLGDGATGMAMIKSYGGLAVVQLPQEAAYPSMPATAIAYGKIDYIVPIKEMAPLLIKLVNEQVQEVEGTATYMQADSDAKINGDKPQTASPAQESTDLDGETRPAEINQDIWEQEHNARNNKSAPFSCPDCGGVLWQIEENGVTHFQCHVGHRLDPEVLLIRKSEELETALWACVRTLQEKAILNRQFADRLRRQGQAETAARIEEKAELDIKTIKVLREQIIDIIPNPVAQSYAVLEDWEQAGGHYNEA